MSSNTTKPSSRLFYRTGEEVKLGDRVRMKRFLRRDLEGKVCYLPGISPRHDELEYEDVKQWAIRTDDGSVYPILYDPENFQPPKRIVFVARTDDQGLQPSEVLE